MDKLAQTDQTVRRVVTLIQRSRAMLLLATPMPNNLPATLMATWMETALTYLTQTAQWCLITTVGVVVLVMAAALVVVAQVVLRVAVAAEAANRAAVVVAVLAPVVQAGAMRAAVVTVAEILVGALAANQVVSQAVRLVTAEAVANRERR